MRVLLATEPGAPGRPNEDFAAISPGLAVLLDGAGSPPGRENGCVHGVAWYARTLGGLLLAGASGAATPLTDVLGEAIGQVSRMHAGTCDLSHPATPAATVIVARQRPDSVDYLVLGDSVLLLQSPHGDPRAVTDTRLADFAARLRPTLRDNPAGTAGHEAARLARARQIDTARNRPGGFWSAASDPAAAGHSLTGIEPLASLSAIAILSDGASRLADRYHLASWSAICAVLAERGPSALIGQVREAEAADPDATRWPRGKVSDDATAIWWPLDA
jgi:hypothetical protein